MLYKEREQGEVGVAPLGVALLCATVGTRITHSEQFRAICWTTHQSLLCRSTSLWGPSPPTLKQTRAISETL